jgi:hypothetical protein
MADLGLIPLPNGNRPAVAPSEAFDDFIALLKITLR